MHPKGIDLQWGLPGYQHSGGTCAGVPNPAPVAAHLRKHYPDGKFLPGTLVASSQGSLPEYGDRKPLDVPSRVPAQPVDATLSNCLIQQPFPERTNLSGCTQLEPSQGSVPSNSTFVSDFSL